MLVSVAIFLIPTVDDVNIYKLNIAGKLHLGLPWDGPRSYLLLAFVQRIGFFFKDLPFYVCAMCICTHSCFEFRCACAVCVCDGGGRERY